MFTTNRMYESKFTNDGKWLITVWDNTLGKSIRVFKVNGETLTEVTVPGVATLPIFFLVYQFLIINNILQYQHNLQRQHTQNSLYSE